MADADKTAKHERPANHGADVSAVAKGNKGAVHGAHDRVAMLSLRADGTPDQSPGVETLLDEEDFKQATREQFRQQAISAADTHYMLNERPVAGGTLVGDEYEEERSTGDPHLDARVEHHQAVAEEAEKAADAAAKDVTG